MTFEPLINTEIAKINLNFRVNCQSQSFILLINVVGILTFMRRINLFSADMSMKKSFITSGLGQTLHHAAANQVLTICLYNKK